MTDDAEIDRLIAIMRRHGIVELEHEANGQRIRLVLPDGASPAPVAPEPRRDEVIADPATARDLIEVRAGIPGCFYRAPEEGADPFVSEGSQVAAGQTLALLEAMKMFTPLEADQAGEIVEIIAQNGDMVARGDVLFRLRPLP